MARVFIQERREDNILGVSQMNARLVELITFIQFLRDNCGFVFNINNFNHRIILQKYVFIAKSLGWNCPDYAYNIYMRGPYSPELAKDYYALDDEQISNTDYKKNLLKFDQVKFIQVIQGKTVDWLEIATTLVSLYNNNRHRMSHDELISFVYERATEIKSNHNPDFIAYIFHELEQYGLIRSN